MEKSVKEIYLSAYDDNQIDRTFIVYDDGSIDSLARGAKDHQTYNQEISKLIRDS